MNDIEDLILILPWKPRDRSRMNAGDPNLTLQSGRDRVEMPFSDEGGVQTDTGALVVYRVSSTSVQVTWGVVEGTIPSNINSTIAAGSNSAIWMEITMQKVQPWGVVSAQIMASADFPDITEPPYVPDPVTGEPPEKVMFPLAVSDDGEISNTNGAYGGSIGIYRNSVSHFCQSADPTADPPREGGIVNTLEWVTYRV